MDRRIKIGIPFNYNEGWIGGTYYIVNLIKSLNLLDDAQKPEIIIFYKDQKELSLLNEINYQYLKLEKIKTWRNLSTLERAVNKVSWKVIKKNTFEVRPKEEHIDILFPANNSPYFKLITDKQKLFWIPDFQEHFLPIFFTEEEIKGRKKYQKELLDRKVNIVFSSNSALKNFNEIYPNSKNETSVVPFAVSAENEYEKIDIKKLCKKFKIPKKYFICSNQFWAHKNHITVLKAVKTLKQDNINCHIVFTGNTTDYRNPNFYQSLLDFIEIEKLSSHVSFLGFIDRNEQLKLMSKATAVIQPSLFEGWGTVAEDAKSMSQHIVLSDIEVHKEQCKENVTFFEPKNEKELYNIISNFTEKKPVKQKNDYKKNQIKFVKTFLAIINKCQN